MHGNHIHSTSPKQFCLFYKIIQQRRHHMTLSKEDHKFFLLRHIEADILMKIFTILDHTCSCIRKQYTNHVLLWCFPTVPLFVLYVTSEGFKSTQAKHMYYLTYHKCKQISCLSFFQLQIVQSVELISTLCWMNQAVWGPVITN